MLALAALLVACGSEPSPPPAAPPPTELPAPPTPPLAQGELHRLPVQIVAWSVTGTGSGLIHDAAQALASSDCLIHDGSPHDVRLHGRVGASGALEWMADDAAESVLGTCLWDPFFRPAQLGPGDFELRVSLADAPAALPAATEPPPPIDWSGLTCRHRVRAHCPPEHTCPDSVWTDEPCPSP